jgi:hypothetical protein
MMASSEVLSFSSAKTVLLVHANTASNRIVRVIRFMVLDVSFCSFQGGTEMCKGRPLRVIKADGLY